ncbi:MAG: PA0069 family radical SAM protein [Leptolyngbya sp. PLA3]|nr:MAG: PA0069 family radical SAM protein [Cyanobacteria bacterium CYA]MCE7968747.1 PA0069 family radical SAM protein [Leptolyngbya sp. PL-A3]
MRPESADPLIRGRGSVLNPPNRFEKVGLTIDGEHLDEVAAEHPHGRQVSTQILVDTARTIINRVDSPDLPFHWTINPYRGCEHGCSYCYARPTHETFGLSCGVDFETKIYAKRDAAALLRAELSSAKWCGESIMMSGITDPYQPIERELRITRQCLEVMAEFGQPVSIITKNRLVTRDIDLLRKLAAEGRAVVRFSLTTLDAKLSSVLEPRASSPRDRLKAIRELTDAGIPVGVMTAPIIPGLNDEMIPALLEAAAEAGAQHSAWTLLRLPWQVEQVFEQWLRDHLPDRADRVMNTLKSARGGKVYDAGLNRRLRGWGARAEQIGKMHTLMCRRFGLDKPSPVLPLMQRRGQGMLFGE